jgi:hypothetical protein
MKKWLTILFFITCFAASAQRKPIDFYTFEDNDPQQLALFLTRSLTSEKDKVRAIFHWITDNISYRVRDPFLQRPRIINEREDTSAWKSADEMVARQVLQKGSGVCDGYARLFKTLCNYAGVQSEIVTGYARVSMDRNATRFRTNHSWNAVRIDSAWHLLDATWASGYLTYNEGVFIRHYDGFYFMTPPDQLIRTHYPEDLRWTLLPDPPAMKEFEQGPFRHHSFVKYHITSFQPSRGIIEAAVGDTIRIEVEVKDADRNRKIAPGAFIDTAIFNMSASWAFLKPGLSVSPRKLFYHYIVPSNNVSWLHILYNDDVILQYRLKTRTQQ